MNDNFEPIENDIFRDLACGKCFKKICEKYGISRNAFQSWTIDPKTRERYERYINGNGLYDGWRRIRKITFSADTTPMPSAQNKAAKFKEKLNVGDAIHNKRHNEKGIVIKKFKDIFLIRTESGYTSAYGYNCFMDF